MGLNAWIAGDAYAAFTVQQHTHFMQHILHHFGASISSAVLIGLIQKQED
jgi:hypothetical protein